MADTKTTLTWLLHDQVSGTAHKIDQALGKTAATAGGGTGVFGKLGGAIGGLINPTTLAIGAVGALTAGVGDAIKHAVDHQVVSERLNTVLKANIAGYNGNRDAIDSYIAKQMDLGFTVDETTAAYAQLIGATHDSRKAQEFLSAAQDLARLKGISLADATDAMTKVEAGRFRGLANLGIVLQKGATATDALAAVQKVAAGQASAYADTAAGHIASLNAKWDDLMTKAGDTIGTLANNFAGWVDQSALPAISKLQKAIADFVVDFVHAIERTDKYRTGAYAGLTPSQANTAYHTGKFPAPGEVGNMQSLVGGARGPSTAYDFLTALAGASRTQRSQSYGQDFGVPKPVQIILKLDNRVLATAVDQHLYYMLRGSPATRMRN